MGLIDLKTDLKSLRYGQDTPGGGNSGQPYIKSKIPEGYSVKSPDFLLRNGFLAPKDALTDVARLAKWNVLPLTNGLLFTAKQIALSRQGSPAQGGTPQAPKNLNVNEGVYTPLSTLAQAGVVAFGGHLNKQGLNPFTSTGAYANNPNLYFDKAKTSNLSANNYIRTEQVTTQANTFTTPLNIAGTQFDVPFGDIVFGSSEPLLGEITFSTGTTTITSVDFQNRLANLWYNKIERKTEGIESTNILSYTGGPGSILGFGKTNIRFADQRTGINSLKIDWLDGTKTWTPNQEINRDFTTLIGKETAIGASKAYATTNQLTLDNDTVDGTRVYISKVGLDAKLFNPLATSFITWTPNTQISRSFTDLQQNLFKKGVSRTLLDLESPYNKNYSGLPDNSGDKVYTPGQVGLDAKLFNPNATGPVTWTPKQITNSTDNLRRLISQSPTSRKFNLLVSGSNNDISLSNLTPPSVYKPGPDQTILNNNDEILYANGSVTYTQKQIEESPYGEGENNDGKKTGAPKLQDFRKKIRQELGETPIVTKAKEKGILPDSPDYTDYNYEARVNIGGRNDMGPGNSTGKNLTSYSSGSGIGPIDKINALPIYRSEKAEPINDLVKFRIAAIDNNAPNFKTFIHFRAFIDSFSDSYQGAWLSTNYLGRGENFYTYDKFTRTISLAFTVVAQSKEELIPMYKKLNYLASNLAPDYSEYGYMRGPLVQLTMGGYLYEQVGFITQLTYDIPESSPWEIGINDKGESDSTVKELPHIIKVTGFGFTPIHDFVPSKQGLGFGKTGNVTSYGNQRYIALSAGGVSNYNK